MRRPRSIGPQRVQQRIQRAAHAELVHQPGQRRAGPLAAECVKSAHGAYKITTHILPNDASQQRQQLVMRLAAKDASIDMMSLDPVFVAEFAEAGFLATVPSS